MTSAERFLELYAESYDKGAALKESGLTARLLRKMTEPRWIEYDEAFTEGFLEVEEELKAQMFSVARGVAMSDSRQKLGAAKWLAGEVDKTIERVELAHIRFLEDRAREMLTGNRESKRIGGNGGGTLSIEEMKGSGGRFQKIAS